MLRSSSPGEGGEGDGRQHVGAIALADAPDQVVAVLVGECDVADDDGRPHRVDARDRGVDVGGVGDLRAGVLEHAPNQDARVEVVLDHEDADAVEAGQRRGGRRRGGAVPRCRTCRGSRTDERRAVLIAGARRGDAAVVRFDEVTDDREPEPEAAVPAFGAGVLLAEPLEDVRQELPGDAAALVGDRRARGPTRSAAAGPRRGRPRART